MRYRCHLFQNKLDMEASSALGVSERQFICELCGLSAPFSYYGQKPPDTRAIVLLEECFVMKDPFSSNKDKFLILGSSCSLCHRTVCVGTDCSLFYTRRFCLPCVHKNLDQFPQQIRTELAKKKTSLKISSTA